MKQCLLLFALFFTFQSLKAQLINTIDEEKFVNLVENRSRLQASKDELSFANESLLLKIDKFDSSLQVREIQYQKSLLKRIKSIKYKDESMNFLYEDSNSVLDKITSLQTELTNYSTNKIKMEKNIQKMKEIQEEISKIEMSIYKLLGSRRERMSLNSYVLLIFTVLTLALMCCVFLVTRSDQIVRQSIFGKDSGIQFITLFLIVMAIILFGITGILEGKELSALIGSVAGYILGRSGVTRMIGNNPVNNKSQNIKDTNESGLDTSKTEPT